MRQVIVERPVPPPPDPGAGTSGLTTQELRALYGAYRTRQARGLIRLLPREAVRPMYRRALESRFDAQDAQDPLGTLLLYCERLLPLPPFETWLEDFRTHAAAHLSDLDDSADVPTVAAPATVEARPFGYLGSSWIAQLRSYREGSTWRGYIAFEEVESRRTHRTAVIFRESDPVDLRERFLSFDGAALQAFLRSALP